MNIISEELKNVILDKATGKKVQLDPLMEELLDIYFGDVNSSTVREYVTTIIAGYEPLPGKLGRDAIDPVSNKEKECKPKNWSNKKKPSNGSGCFNDYTRKRFNKDIKENLDIVSSFFIDGECVYVLEYNISAIADKLDVQIKKKCEDQGNSYVRSAAWTYSSFINHDSLKFHYLNKSLIEKNPKCMCKPFKDMLLTKSENKCK